jgi:hypothetical protein
MLNRKQEDERSESSTGRFEGNDDDSSNKADIIKIKRHAKRNSRTRTEY